MFNFAQVSTEVGTFIVLRVVVNRMNEVQSIAVIAGRKAVYNAEARKMMLRSVDAAYELHQRDQVLSNILQRKVVSYGP